MVLRADGNNETSVFLLLFFHGHAVFWYSQLPQTVQFQLLLIFVMWTGDPISLTPESLDHHAGEREMAFQPIRDRHCKAA